MRKQDIRLPINNVRPEFLRTKNVKFWKRYIAILVMLPITRWGNMLQDETRGLFVSQIILWIVLEKKLFSRFKGSLRQSQEVLLSGRNQRIEEGWRKRMGGDDGVFVWFFCSLACFSLTPSTVKPAFSVRVPISLTSFLANRNWSSTQEFENTRGYRLK